MISAPISLSFENVTTGRRKPILAGPVKLTDYGDKPTVLAITDTNVPAVEWAVTLNGQTTPKVKSWRDTNRPFRLMPGDRGLPLDLVGNLVVTATPCGLDGSPMGPGVTATLAIVTSDTGVDDQSKTTDDQSPPQAMKLVACWDYDLVPTSVPQITSSGLAGVRCFGNGFTEDGKLPVGQWSTLDYADQMHTADPNLLYIDLRGGKQGENGMGGQVLSEDGLKRSVQTYAKAIAGWGRWFVCEGPYNEINLREYFDLGQNPSKPDARVVKYAVRGTQILRAAVGPERDIVSPAIGWTGGKLVHREWIKAFADAGMFDPKTAANICGDHAYSYLSPAELGEQAQLVREVIPSSMHQWWTECGIHYFPDFRVSRRKLWAETVAAAQAGGIALLAVYRGLVNAKRSRKADPVSLFNADGTPNVESINGVGLKVAI